jgi:hypothetical protein
MKRLIYAMFLMVCLTSCDTHGEPPKKGSLANHHDSYAAAINSIYSYIFVGFISLLCGTLTLTRLDSLGRTRQCGRAVLS